MNPSPNSLSTEHYSAINWLALSGVVFETANDSCTWNIITTVNNATLSESKAATTQPKRLRTEDFPEFERFASLDALNQYVQGAKGIALHKTASHAVLGKGPLQPDLMIISDMPDDSEDISGQAFEGIGNQMIMTALKYAGFSSGTLYTTYLSKWRSPGQRALTPGETDYFAKLLDEEIRLVEPKALLILGESTFKAICPGATFRQAASGTKINIQKQYFNLNFMVLASQKGEFLIKNPGMKKSFWLSLLQFAAAMRAPT